MADLTTLGRLLDALNKAPADLEPYETRKYESALRAASAAIRAYTDRDFALNTSGIATARTYEYDDSGYIDIADAQSVTGVTINFPFGGAPVSLSTTQWQALPFDAAIKDNIIIFGPTFQGMNREMGFTQNYDRFEGPLGGVRPTVEVTAVWGWPAIPEDVQQAAVWTAAAFAEDARQITSESIEGFSRAMNVLAPTALPLRARDLLDEYRRVVV